MLAAAPHIELPIFDLAIDFPNLELDWPIDVANMNPKNTSEPQLISISYEKSQHVSHDLTPQKRTIDNTTRSCPLLFRFNPHWEKAL